MTNPYRPSTWKHWPIWNKLFNQVMYRKDWSDKPTEAIQDFSYYLQKNLPDFVVSLKLSSAGSDCCLEGRPIRRSGRLTVSLFLLLRVNDWLWDNHCFIYLADVRQKYEWCVSRTKAPKKSRDENLLSIDASDKEIRNHMSAVGCFLKRLLPKTSNISRQING